MSSYGNHSRKSKNSWSSKGKREARRNKKRSHHTPKKKKLKLIQGSSALDADNNVDQVELIRQRGLMEDARIRRKIEKERQERKQHIEHAKDTIRQNTGLIAMESYADINKNLSEREEMNKKIADSYFSDGRKFQKRSEELEGKYGEEAAKRDEANKSWSRSGLLSFRKKGDTKEMKKLLENVKINSKAAANAKSIGNATLGFNKQVDKKRKINDEKMEKIIASRMGAKLGGKTKKKRRRRTKKKRRKRRKSRKKRRRSRRRRRR